MESEANMQKNKSISGKIKKLKSYQTQQRVLSDWVKGWESDQKQVIQKLRWAAQHDDHGEIMHMIDQLSGLTEKRMIGLKNVLNIISNPDRKLIDIRVNAKAYDTDSVVPEKNTSKLPKKRETVIKEKSLEVDEMIKNFTVGMSTGEIAKVGNISVNKVIKILVTEGVYQSDVYDRIKNLRMKGKSEIEIADEVGINLKTLNNYSPYKKGVYKSHTPQKTH